MERLINIKHEPYWSRRLWVWCSVTILTTIAYAQDMPDDTFYARYPFIFCVDSSETVTLSDEVFFDRAAKVLFPVAKTQLPLDDALLDELRRVIIPRMNNDSLQILRLIIRGAASPEGSVEVNQRLGHQRAQALLDFLMKYTAYQPASGVLSTTNDIEDYRTLCLLMQHAGDPDAAMVRAIVEPCLANGSTPSALKQLKSRLQRQRGGQLWRRLLATYFPQLRAARMILVLRKVPLTVATHSIRPVSVVGKMDPTSLLNVEAVPTLPIIATTPTTPTTTSSPRRALLSVKTNLLFYGAYVPGYDRWCPIPNIAVEYYPKRGHFTFGGSFDMPWWQDYDAHKYFQFRNYQVEARYYLKPSHLSPLTSHRSSHAPHASHPSPLTSYLSTYNPYRGFYFSAYVHGGVFGICFDADRGWVGEGAGGGIGAGYVTPISKRGNWRLEFGVQAGFFRCKYDPYQYENPVNPAYRDHLYYYKWTGKPELFKKRQYRWNWLGPTRIGVTLAYDLIYRKKKPKSPTPGPSRGGEGRRYLDSQK